jgi:hypothetical protein
MKSKIQKRYLDRAETINTRLIADFLEHYLDDNVKRTHLFNGRYENIYLGEHQIRQLSNVLEHAKQLAAAITDVENIRAGYWFNYMLPGAVTTLHRHDDDDELLSAVYYVSVPENSGNLVLHQAEDVLEVTPEAGMFVFFPPDVAHEVTQNYSERARLSIGFNFGPADASH